MQTNVQGAVKMKPKIKLVMPAKKVQVKAPDPIQQIRIVDTEAKAKVLVKELFSLEVPVVVDTETTGLDYMKDTVVVWSMSWKLNRVFILGSLIPIFREWLESDKPKICHNTKYDTHIFTNHGVVVAGKVACTMVMDWLADENREWAHGLKDCSKDHLNVEMREYGDLFGDIPLQMILDTNETQDFTPILELFSGRVTKKDRAAGIEWRPNASYKKLYGEGSEEDTREQAIERFKRLYPDLLDYSTFDAVQTQKLFKFLKNRLMNIPNKIYGNMWEYYKAVEEPFTRVLKECERQGFHLDVTFLREVEEIIDKKLMDVERRFVKESKTADVDLSSPKQIVKLFYHDLKYPKINYTEGLYCKECLRDATKATNYKCKEHGGKYLSKKPSTDDETLQELADKGYKLAGILMEHRGLSKLQSTYVKGLLEVAHNGKIHTAFKQIGTVTGRLSSGDKKNGYPNMQNIPTLDKDAFKIRQAFVAPKGEILIVKDYSQLELRLLAHFSGDKNMINVYKNDGDIHTETAKAIFNLGADEKPEGTQRKYAKAINFGIAYGKSAYTLSLDLGISVDEAEIFLLGLFRKYPRLKLFMDNTPVECREHGYVETLLGRRRTIPEIRSNDFKIFGHAKRQSVNSIIQGSASDIAKKAMIKTSEVYNKDLRDMGCRLISQVHDELMFTCPRSTAKDADKLITDLMENPLDFQLKVPLKVDGGRAIEWGCAKN